MREIKFRAWNGSKMIVPQENSYYQHYVSFCGGIVQKSSEGMECLGGGDIWRRVNNTILMQYTGLKDCNGVEIFEGDVLSDGHFNWFVVFIDGSFWAKRESTVENIMVLKRKRHIAMKHDCIEIIGNIHENPELLEREA